MRETRTVTLDAAEVRADETSGALSFRGHAAVFNERTWIGPRRRGFWEQIDSGFFRNVLDDDAAFLVNHDPSIVLARNGNTMSLSVDERGLLVDASWDPKDPEASMWAGRIARGDVSKMSFAFTVADKGDRWEDAEDDGELRTLLTAERLFDASLVTYPAYEGTDGALRAEERQVEAILSRHREVVEARRPVVDNRPMRLRAMAARYRLDR